MKILVITQMFSQPDDAGDNKPTKTVNYFVKEWTAMGHEVVVMHCPSKFPLILYKLPNVVKNKFAGRISTMVPPIESRKIINRHENGAKIYRYPMLKLVPGSAYSKGAMQKQAKIIETELDKIEFKPDLVLGHFANPSTELVAKIAEYYNAKSSIVFHQDCSETNIHKYRLFENARRIKAIGCRSIVEAEQVRKLLGINDVPFVCCSGVPNDAVIAAEKVCTKQDYSNGIKYIYVGSLIKRKYLDVVLKAFASVANSNDSLEVVGGGPEEEKLKQLASNLQTDDFRIEFTGRIPRKNVLEKMKNAHVFTLISDSETYGMVYIEAMLQGCITIASKNGGFDGIIQDGINGFICEPGNGEMLLSIYKRIAGMTTDERNAMGQAAIDTAKHYSEKEVAERYLDDILIRQ